MEANKIYIRERVINNIEESRRGREASNFKGEGLDYGEHKFTGKNFEKMMRQRGFGEEDIKNAKQSFNKWAPDERDPKVKEAGTATKDKNASQDVTAKHSRPEGEKGYVYSTDGKSASGVYVADEKIEESDKVKDRYATPASNRVDKRVEVRVHGDQVRGTTAAQPGWAKEAGDGVERKGGGTQILTNGGFKNNAVREVEGTQYDMKKGDSGKGYTDSYGVTVESTEEKSEGKERQRYLSR